jgi:hypothetical protein
MISHLGPLDRPACRVFPFSVPFYPQIAIRVLAYELLHALHNATPDQMHRPTIRYGLPHIVPSMCYETEAVEKQ